MVKGIIAVASIIILVCGIVSYNVGKDLTYYRSCGRGR